MSPIELILPSRVLFLKAKVTRNRSSKRSRGGHIIFKIVNEQKLQIALARWTDSLSYLFIIIYHHLFTSRCTLLPSCDTITFEGVFFRILINSFLSVFNESIS